ncbi:hypothetical protein F4860DRAFT_517127 [Xylaria cubensis]|nr:hypothetical protein F4860DRAFT_517127 [Xylaria cubensis]
MPRRQTKRAKNREFGRRTTPFTITGSLACRGCFGRAHNAFQPKAGEPLEVGCVMSDPGASSCKGCRNGHDVCVPIPAMLQFDATRLDELLQWSFDLFDPERTDPDDLTSAVVYDADVIYPLHRQNEDQRGTCRDCLV